jgi:hypothetical protein
MRNSKIDAILELIDSALAGATCDAPRAAPTGGTPPAKRHDVRTARVATDPR